VCGERLFAVTVGEEPQGTDTRSSVVLSGVHPMEWIGVEALLGLLDRLVANPPATRSVVCVPLVNPDGRLRVEQNLRAGRRRLVRHNARGVDLNRNFDADWGRSSLGGHLVPWLYRPGRHAASEPEVAAIANGLSRRRIDRAVSLHSFGSCVLYPGGRGLLPIADAPEHAAWARHVARALGHARGHACPASRLLPGLGAGGMELDWFHRRHGALSLLVECPGGGVPRRLERLANPFAWYNPADPREVADRVAGAIVGFVRGDEVPGTT
jgi:predicted deacylase